MTSSENQGWVGAHKKLAAVLATATALLGLTTGGLTLRDRISGGDDEPAKEAAAPPGEPTTETAESREGSLTEATAAKLSDDVQLSRFEQLLGAPTSKNRLPGDEWLVTTWESPDIVVTAFSNRDSQVVAYTLTSLAPDYTPLVEHLPGGIRLRDSVFAEVPVEPDGVTGVYPPNGRHWYAELYLGGTATADKSVVLANSFAANADDPAGDLLLPVQKCIPFSLFDPDRGCPADRLGAVRSGLHVTSMTVGADSSLEALEASGALFFPDPDTGS